MLVDLSGPRKSTIHTFSINHLRASGDRYFRIVGGAPSNVAGYPVISDSMITKLSFVNQKVASGNLLIYKDTTLIHTLVVASQLAKIETGLSISLSEGEVIKAVIGSGEFDYPVLNIEVLWNQ